MSNLTEQFFKAYNANDMQRVRQYVAWDIVYIEMEVKTRFVLLSRLGTTEPGDFAFLLRLEPSENGHNLTVSQKAKETFPNDEYRESRYGIRCN